MSRLPLRPANPERVWGLRQALTRYGGRRCGGRRIDEAAVERMTARFKQEAGVLHGNQCRRRVSVEQRSHHAIVGRHDVLPFYRSGDDSPIGRGARTSRIPLTTLT